MIGIKNAAQIEKMRQAGALLHRVLAALRPLIVPGANTWDMDEYAEKLIREAGAKPSFKGYHGFPSTLCASPDEKVVHGFPNGAPLEEGHILSIDAGLILDGWQADSAFTAPVGEISPEMEALIRVTEECFWKGAEQARAGMRLGDVSHAVQEHAEKHGYGVIRDLCGHGIGRAMHEEPDIPNFGEAGHGVRLRAGMTLAIEPMICAGHWPVKILDDGWTVVTRDQSWCSHYEHTVLVTDGDPEILTLPDATLRGGGR